MNTKPRILHRQFTALLAATALTTCAITANAANYVVQNNNDSGNYSLRAAVITANITPGPDTITFDPGVSTITLTSGQIDITDELTITGSATAGQTISGNDASRIFAVTNASSPLTLENLTLTNGKTTADRDSSNRCTITDGVGGALCTASDLTLTAVTVQNSETSGDDADGGGVFVSNKFGLVSISNSRFVNNAIQGASATGSAMRLWGDTAIDNSIFSGNTGVKYHAVALTIAQDTTISNSTFSNNQPAALYVGDYPSYDSVLSVVNSTFSGNFCKGASYIAELGECSNGVAVSSSVATNLINSTVTENIVPKDSSSTSAWAAVMLIPTDQEVALQSSIVAGNLTANGSFSNLFVPSYVGDVNANNSIIGDDASEVTGTDSNNVFTNESQLGPLADNGCAVKAGAPGNDACVQTHKPNPGSPAIDAGANPNALDFDERGAGYPRTVNGQTDIGAFEAPVEPGLTITPANVDFGTVAPSNTAGPEVITLTNPGTGILTVSSIDVATSDFVLNGGSCGVTPFTITAGNGCSINYSYTPSAVGADTQTINVASDAVGSNADDSFVLQGVGNAAPELRINPASINFGAITVGNTAAPVQVVLTNPGTDDLTISSINAAAGEFALSGGSCGATPITIAPLNNCTLTYTFAPTSVGVATQTLNVISDGVNESDVSFDLLGTGTANGNGNGDGNGNGALQATPLPAVSAWSFMLLVSLMGGFGLYHSKRRR